MISQINKWSKATRKALVSNKNIIFYYQYLREQFLDGPENENPCHLLFDNDPDKEKFFLNKDEWCALEQYVEIVKKARKISGNFEITKMIGALFPRALKEYRMQSFADAAKYNMGIFRGPNQIFKQISFYSYLFNQTKTMDFVYGRNGECAIKIKFNQGIDPVFDFVSEWHIEGLLASIMDLFGLEKGQVFSLLKEYDLKMLIEEEFPDIKEKCLIEGNIFKLGDNVIAEKAALVPEKIQGKEIFLGKTKPYQEGGKNWVWKIIRDVYMNNKYHVLKKDEVYNAPYFMTFIQWKKKNILEAVTSISLNNFSPLGSGYSRIIKDRLEQEQDSMRLRSIIQQKEEELHRLLLRNYIHPQFIERAKLGPIPFKEILATNIFFDLAESTVLRKTMGHEKYRENWNFFLEIVTKCLFASAGEWGWINKVEGDGCFVVIGAYNYFKDEYDYDHVEMAMDFIQSLIKEVMRIKSLGQHLQGYNLRVGVSVGKTDLGEAHTQKIAGDSNGLELSALRFFDVGGMPVVLAKRIEEAGKTILVKEGQGRKGGVFVCPELKELVKNNPKYNFRKIDIEKLNIVIRDNEDMKEVYELEVMDNQ
jgi:class 3 adenylate cyclase